MCQIYDSAHTIAFLHFFCAYNLFCLEYLLLMLKFCLFISHLLEIVSCKQQIVFYILGYAHISCGYCTILCVVFA